MSKPEVFTFKYYRWPQVKQDSPSEKTVFLMHQFELLSFPTFFYLRLHLFSTIFWKFIYADNLAFLYFSGNWKTFEGLSHTKTMTTAIHFNNEKAKREI